MSAEKFLASLERWFQPGSEPPEMGALRRAALERAHALGVPTPKMERWRQSGVANVFEHNYNLPKRDRLPMSPGRCQLDAMATTAMHFSAGKIESAQPLQRLQDGVIAGSLRAAMKEEPELVQRLLAERGLDKMGFFNAVNMALFTDGFFLHVPKNVVLARPIQVIHVLGEYRDALENLRNFVVLEEGAEATLLFCDHSSGREYGFASSVNQFQIGPGAGFKLYRVQNLSDEAACFHQDFFTQQENSRLFSHTIGFNGGLLRGETHVDLQGKGADCEFVGLSLSSRGQRMENFVKVEHQVPHCTSREVFKNIVDDYARGLFNGHVLVHPDAQKTEAYQNNSNIVLTDKAKMSSRPFLEIYADDVKCSHGSSVGQLDDEALFYMRQRGISEENARLLLLYAFAADVINQIDIEPLRRQLDDMVKKRLRGELPSCEDCVLSCSQPEFEVL
ncbi:MAG: Fe-S cluster assembly protein SufD [Desulforhopalus sp.]|nr:Fe-S cluster assembly protein SufD [Desulforhopalus sp.]